MAAIGRYCVGVGVAIGIGIEKTMGALMGSGWLPEARRRGTTPIPTGRAVTG
jgi:hypothetical protein